MKICKIILIDSPAEITLVKESIPYIPTAVDLKYCTSVDEFILALKGFKPDAVLIGSKIIIEHMAEVFRHVKHFPTVVLCEGEGFEIMLKERPSGILFLARPFSLEDIPRMLQKAVEFSKSCKDSSDHTFQDQRGSQPII